MFHKMSREEEIAEIGMAIAVGASRMIGFRPRKINPGGALLSKCRGMVRQDESPWVTFRYLIRAGQVRLVSRRGKPPLLVACKQ